MERMRKSAQRFEEESDPEDWFRSSKNRSATSIPTQPRLMREGNKERPRDSDRQKDRHRDREWEHRKDNDSDKQRQRDTDRDREHDRKRDMNSRDRGRGRDENQGRERHREKEWETEKGMSRRSRDKDRGGERDKPRERSQVQHEGQRRHANESSTMRIKFSSTRMGQPTPQSGLPPRPRSLLERMGEVPQEESQPLSIKGAGQKRSRDDHRRNYEPRYRGGYA